MFKKRLLFLYQLRGIVFQCELINQAACDLAREVANEGDALVAGNICETPSYLSGLGKEVVQNEFQQQIDVFVKNDVDFLIGEVNLHSDVDTQETNAESVQQIARSKRLDYGFRLNVCISKKTFLFGSLIHPF